MQKVKTVGTALRRHGPCYILIKILDRLNSSSLVCIIPGWLQRRRINFQKGNLVVFYPVVKTKEELQDLIARACWYLGSRNVREFRFYVANQGLAERATHPILPEGFDPQICKLIPEFVAKSRFIAQTDNGCTPSIKTGDVLLCFRRDKPSNDTLAREFSQFSSATSLNWCVDSKSDPKEGANYTSAAFHLTRRKKRLIWESRKKFEQLSEKLSRFDRSNVIATGPSFSEWKKLDYRNALNIICNSTITNKDLMQTMKPQILVFADPIFHFGPSEYAGRFRKELRVAANHYDFSIMIPIKYLGIFLSAMPDLSNRLIGIPFEVRDDFNLDLQQEFVVRVTANILTMLMLPVATTFASEVFLVGCDGKPASESDYFWKHNPSAQFNSELKGIQSTHKSFFAINYDSYYNMHCELVAAFCEQAETKGKQVYSAVPSHIPALSQREKLPIFEPTFSGLERTECIDGERKDQAFQKVVIVDPTLLGRNCSTGQLKQLLFSGHPPEKLLHVFRMRNCMAILSGKDIDLPRRIRRPLITRMLRWVREFGPDVIYFRSTGDTLLDLFTRRLISEWPADFVLHVMDDWPSMINALGKPESREADSRFRQLIFAADKHLCISGEMAHSFRERYGREFVPIANGVPSNQIAKAPKDPSSKIVVRYLGALAHDMNLQAVSDVAEAVNSIASESITLEIYTSDSWMKGAKQIIEESCYVKLKTALESKNDYWQTLHESDVLLIAYNFDKVSQAYTKYSFANKLPECLASGAVVLGYGPEGNATLDFVKNKKVGMVVNKQGQQFVQAALLYLADDKDYRIKLAGLALRIVRERFQEQDVVHRFQAHIACKVANNS